MTLNSKFPEAEKKLWQAQGTARCLIYSLNHKPNFSQLRLNWRIRNQVLKSELTQAESEVSSKRTLDEESLSWTWTNTEHSLNVPSRLYGKGGKATVLGITIILTAA